jgi:Protein of unknown function (DUF2795)
MVSSDKVREYLETVDFPADREAVVREAQARGAPDIVLKALRAMPPDTYRNASEVLSSAGTDLAPELSARDKAAKALDKKHRRVAEPLRTATTGTRFRVDGPNK